MKIILIVDFVDFGYCILRYIFGKVFLDDLYDFDSNFLICFLSVKFMDKCLNLRLGIVRLKGLVILDDGEIIVCVFFFFSWFFVVKEWIMRNWNRCWLIIEMIN